MFPHTILHLLGSLLSPTVIVAVLVYDALLIAAVVLLVRRFRRRRAAARLAGAGTSVPVRPPYRKGAPEIAPA